jgi:hypothetical protein
MPPISIIVAVILDTSTLMELVYLVMTHFVRIAVRLMSVLYAMIMHQTWQIAPATWDTSNPMEPAQPAVILYVIAAAQPILVLNARQMLALILPTANVFRATSN